MPWHFFQNPLEQWQALPSFVVVEALFIALAGLALWHARARGRVQQLVWVGALVAGTANDLIFMALPLVDNFWHSQATIMLTPRLPLYIPCVYISFLYYPTVAVRRLGMNALGAAALTGLVAVVFYAPFDITGAKLLWWTWHDTDLPVASRILGAPTSSTLWVLTFAGSFSWLVNRAISRATKGKTIETGDADEIDRGTFARGLALAAGLSTILMMLQITVLQQLDGGAPAYLALGVGLSIYAVVAARGLRSAVPRPTRSADRLASAGVAIYAATLALCMAAFDPASHHSTGLHQLPGPCYVEARDITGLTRHAFLCVADYEEDFTFECAEADRSPADATQWYTVCGRAHTNFAAWMSAVALLGVLMTALFFWLFGLPTSAQGPRDP